MKKTKTTKAPALPRENVKPIRQRDTRNETAKQRDRLELVLLNQLVILEAIGEALHGRRGSSIVTNVRLGKAANATRHELGI